MKIILLQLNPASLEKEEPMASDEPRDRVYRELRANLNLLSEYFQNLFTQPRASNHRALSDFDMP